MGMQLNQGCHFLMWQTNETWLSNGCGETNTHVLLKPIKQFFCKVKPYIHIVSEELLLFFFLLFFHSFEFYLPLEWPVFVVTHPLIHLINLRTLLWKCFKPWRSYSLFIIFCQGQITKKMSTGQEHHLPGGRQLKEHFCKWVVKISAMI